MKEKKKVFARLGFSDIIVPIEDVEKIFSATETYLVGYELEDGKECDEEGNLLYNN